LMEVFRYFNCKPWFFLFFTSILILNKNLQYIEN
jgi:hypothetical protein